MGNCNGQRINPGTFGRGLFNRFNWKLLLYSRNNQGKQKKRLLWKKSNLIISMPFGILKSLTFFPEGKKVRDIQKVFYRVYLASKFYDYLWY